jgi:Family of unknown function (DUF5681)
MATKRKGGRRGNEIKVGDEKPYRVGYGRPPLETRFKPNQSGNPKGRPRRPPSWRAVVETVLEEKVEIRVGDRILRMSNRQAFVRAAFRRAHNGDPRLLRVLVLLMRAEVGLETPEDEAAPRVSPATRRSWPIFWPGTGRSLIRSTRLPNRLSLTKGAVNHEPHEIAFSRPLRGHRRGTAQ